MNDTDRIRAFVAFKIPKEVSVHIRGIQAALSAGGVAMRWTPAENVHLTLKFLSDIQRMDVERVFEVMESAVRETLPIRLTAKGIGVFPGVRRPRVLWIGLKGDTAPLIDLQHRLDEGLAALGFAREPRAFKAHLTVGRARGPIDPRRLVTLMETAGAAESPPFRSDKLILFQSDLFPSGPVYTELKEAALREQAA
ncbi:RNA 2',3'-cyclic phosphodiesterase [Desulfococcus sp.]|uniref:RNA 2',3'-cyclic phosphodiesterase n=1 Tax=Desulfococcus sp. TaxID=2025834 RepID=UPI0035934F16